MYTITARWVIKSGSEAEAVAALKKLAKDVKRKEPHTLLYLVFTPDMTQQSFPAVSAQEVIFIEGYANEKRFMEHINGPVFKKFMAKHSQLFAYFSPTDTRPFMAVEYLNRQGGFVRPAAS